MKIHASFLLLSLARKVFLVSFISSICKRLELHLALSHHDHKWEINGIMGECQASLTPTHMLSYCNHTISRIKQFHESNKELHKISMYLFAPSYLSILHIHVKFTWLLDAISSSIQKQISNLIHWLPRLTCWVMSFLFWNHKEQQWVCWK